MVQASKEVANTKKAKPPALPNEVANQAWGADTVDSNDILLPKLLLAQGLSKSVADEHAQMGDFTDSLTNEVLGTGREKDNKPVRFIPILSFKNWVVNEKLGGDKLQFKEVVDFGPENANWERETDELRRDLVLNFYVLLEDKAEDPTALPHVLSFRRTSYKAGQKLSSHFSKCQMAAARGKPVPPAATVFELSAKKTENDHGVFYVLDVQPAGNTKDAHLQTAWEWFQQLKLGEHKVDNREYSGEAEAETKANESEDF